MNPIESNSSQKNKMTENNSQQQKGYGRTILAGLAGAAITGIVYVIFNNQEAELPSRKQVEITLKGPIKFTTSEKTNGVYPYGHSPQFYQGGRYV